MSSVKSKAEFSAQPVSNSRELVSNLARQNSLGRRIQVSRCNFRLRARRFLDADFSFHVSDFEFSLQSGSRGAFHFSFLVSRFKLREEDDQEMTRSALSISQFSFLGSKARSLIANPPGLRFSFRVSRFHFGALSRTLERAHFSILLSGFYFQGRAGWFQEVSLDGFSIQGRRLQMETGIDLYSAVYGSGGVELCVLRR